MKQVVKRSVGPIARTSIALAALLAGCATHVDSYIKDFPSLEIRVHQHAPGWIILAKCYGDLPTWQKVAGYVPIACTWVDLNKRTCDVFVADNTDPDTVAHEMAHCIGGDHDGILHRMMMSAEPTASEDLQRQ